jgi:hypothetical protein
VPEPGILLLVLSGFGILGIYRNQALWHPAGDSIKQTAL